MSIRVGLRPMARPAMGFPPGWLRGWDYRKSHTITGSVAGAQTNYQVGIKVYPGSGTDGTETVEGIVFGKVYTDSKCQTVYSDIRFTGPDGVTPLDYWRGELVVTYAGDILTGGTASASSEWPGGGFEAWRSFDDVTTTRWSSADVAKPHWIKYDLGAGGAKTANKLRMLPYINQVKDFKLQGSNDDSEWDDLLTEVATSTEVWNAWDFTNETAYRYYRILISSGYAANQSSIWEIELSYDLLTGGTASASSEWPTGGFVAAYSFDNDEATRWSSADVAKPHWIKYDLGAGVTKTARGLRFLPYTNQVKAFKLQGSNDDSEWDDLLTEVSTSTSVWNAWAFANETAYRYYRILISSGYAANQSSIWEIELMESAPTTALFWVEVDSIPESPDTTTIYMYYGKSGVETTSDGEATFLMFDDFPGTSLHEDWTQNLTGSAYLTVADGELTLDSVSANAICAITREGGGVMGSYRVIYRFAVKASYASVNNIGTPGWYRNSYYNRWAWWYSGSQHLYGTADLNWHDIEARPDGNHWMMYLDGVYQATNPDTTTGTAVGLNSSGQSDASHGGKTQYTTIIVNTYCSPEPTHTAWGSEESK